MAGTRKLYFLASPQEKSLSFRKMQLRRASPHQILALLALRGDSCAVKITVHSRKDSIWRSDFELVGGRLDEKRFMGGRLQRESCSSARQSHTSDDAVARNGQFCEKQKRILCKVGS
jgi:hypothetical protein